jgi:hypothetical protein
MLETPCASIQTLSLRAPIDLLELCRDAAYAPICSFSTSTSALWNKTAPIFAAAIVLRVRTCSTASA